MIGVRYKFYCDKALEGVGRKIAASGLRPDQITLLGLALGILACCFLIATRNLLAFAFLILAAGMVDVLDGVVARLGNQTSKFGSYLDAMCDRYFEIFALFSAAFVTGYWGIIFVVATGALLTSYAKARAAMEVAVSNTGWPDFMERWERSALFVLGIVVSQIIPVKIFGRDLFYWSLVLLAAGTHFTVIQRILRAKKLIRAG